MSSRRERRGGRGLLSGRGLLGGRGFLSGRGLLGGHGLPGARGLPGDREPEPDARDTRRAALVIGWQIMAASAVLVFGIIVVAIVFLLHQSLPREQIDLEQARGRIYIDSLDVIKALVVIGAGAVVFAGGVSWFVAQRAVRPLGTALRLQRQFVADASHELRTPLAVLDARLQVLQRRLDNPATSDPAATSATVGELRTDSRALIDIVNDLLLAAGGDDRRTTLDPAPVVAEAAASLGILARDRDVSIEVGVPDALLVSIPAPSLRRCVVALVDNAVGHSPRGGTVRVSGSREASAFVLRVSDEGAGITGIAPERVFERFAHAPQSAAPAVGVDGGAIAGAGAGAGAVAASDGGAAGGPRQLATPGEPARQSFGIGLALVRDIAERQGGRVRVETTSTSGTTMALEVPLV